MAVKVLPPPPSANLNDDMIDTTSDKSDNVDDKELVSVTRTAMSHSVSFHFSILCSCFCCCCYVLKNIYTIQDAAGWLTLLSPVNSKSELFFLFCIDNNNFFFQVGEKQVFVSLVDGFLSIHLPSRAQKVCFWVLIIMNLNDYKIKINERHDERFYRV